MIRDEPAAADTAAIRAAVARARAGLVDREVLTEVVALCAIAGEHLLVVGPPGTAKSEAVRRVCQELGGNYFEYLLGRFTEPNEIFGPVDLRRLREGSVEIRTTGMLPEADIAFLDEVFLGSTAILNTLLGLLNERRFRRGGTDVPSPLRVCVGATNALPGDPALSAFADRFLARVFVEPVADASLEDLLQVGPDLRPAPATGDLLPALDRLASHANAVDTAAVRPVLATAVRRLRGAGLVLTDRRVVRSLRLVAAAAVLDGRSSASPVDLWVLPLVASTADGQVRARDVLSDLLGDARNGSLASAAEEYSRGPAARAARLTQTGRDVLGTVDPADPDGLLRIEAVLREIDAGVPADRFTEELQDVRDRLVSARGRGLPAA